MKRNSKIKILFILLSIFISYFLFFNLKNSILFQKKERINVVFYGKNTAFYSFGIDDGVNYAASFFPNLEIVVPGGYGLYRLGGLGKLVSLEKKPHLFKQAFSSTMSIFIDFYFYSDKDLSTIYFGDGEEMPIVMPGFSTLFMAQTNASIIDRLILYGLFFGKDLSNFIKINFLPYETQGERTIFSLNNFFKHYQSYFYKTTYRSEKQSVQILYTKSYNTSLMISRILEGEGIRVVDIAESKERMRGCKISENKDRFSDTAKSLSIFFNCKLKREQTSIYDILFTLGEREGEWEVE